MKFDIKKKGVDASSKYTQSDLDIAYTYAKDLYKEAKDIIKGIVLFGSTARHEEKSDSDIDLLIVLDDLTIELSKELMQTYKIIAEQLILKHSKRIHLTTLKYSTFFEYARVGDPVGINILRDGVAIVDTGFFTPLQALLKSGQIRPTYESIWTYFHRAPVTLNNSRWHIFRACEDLYWAVMDASHAVIMKLGHIPPTPEHVPELLDEYAVSAKILSHGDVKDVQFFYDLYKSITKRKIKDVTGQQFEKYYDMAQRYIKKCEVYLKK